MKGKRSSASCRGFALMMAIFMIVTLAAVAVYLLTVSTGQIEAVTQDEQGARAYQAARSGIDWGAFQVLRNGGGPFGATCATSAPPLSLGSLGPAGGTNFYAEVSCQRVGNETEGGVTVEVFRLTAMGCNRTPCSGAATPTYVERQLQLTLTRCSPPSSC
jgi:MSHA biogenesis protein MshP